MATETNQSEFQKKLKKFFENRAVVVTVVTLLVATGIIIAATISANRTKQPTPSEGEQTTTQGVVTGEVTLPSYNGSETKPVGADPDEPDAKLALPVTGKLYKAHDATVQVYSETMGDYRVHLGVDIATEAEAPVYAAADGKVKEVWEDAMMGMCVAITHADDTVTVYKNLSKTLEAGIKAGAEVKKGQKIATVGDTAVVEMADDPHLHFEVTVKGLAVNPLDYFSKSSVDALAKDTAFEDSVNQNSSSAK